MSRQRTTLGGLTLAVALAFVVASLPLLQTASAQRAPSDVGLTLSSDGETFGTGLTRPLFDPTLHWVPGDVREAEFLVRNDSRREAQALVDLIEVRVPTDQRLRFSVRIGDGPWRSLETRPSTWGGRLVPPGEVMPVTVRAEMLPSAPNETMQRTIDVDLRVTPIRRDGVAPTAGPVFTRDQTRPDLIAWLPLALLAVALVLIGVTRRRADASRASSTPATTPHTPGDPA